MEYAIALAVIGGFAYFVYTRVRKARSAPSGSGGGGRGDGDTGPIREK